MSASLQPHGLYSPWHSLSQNAGVSSLSLLQGIFPTHRSNPGLPHCRWILYQLSHKGSPRILEWVADPFSSGSSHPGTEPGSPALQVDSLPAELLGKTLLAMQKTQVQSLGWEDPLEKRKSTHSSILIWRIPWTEKPMGFQRVGQK